MSHIILVTMIKLSLFKRNKMLLSFVLILLIYSLTYIFQERIAYSKTFKGKYFNFLGYFFSIYCVWKIFIVSIILNNNFIFFSLFYIKLVNFVQPCYSIRDFCFQLLKPKAQVSFSDQNLSMTNHSHSLSLLVTFHSFTIPLEEILLLDILAVSTELQVKRGLEFVAIGADVQLVKGTQNLYKKVSNDL